jgi:hypothetical protein
LGAIRSFGTSGLNFGKPLIADGQPTNQYPTATAVQRCETDQPGGARADPVTTPS